MDWKVLVRSGGGGRVEMEGGLSGWVVVVVVGDTALEGVSLSSVVVGGWIGVGVSFSGSILESSSCLALVVILDLDRFFDFAMVVNSIYRNE